MAKQRRFKTSTNVVLALQKILKEVTDIEEEESNNQWEKEQKAHVLQIPHRASSYDL